MMTLALAALLFSSAALADDAPPPARAGRVRLPGCEVHEGKDGPVDEDVLVRDAMQDALSKVDSCLSHYNGGAMAREIKKRAKDFAFSCGQEHSRKGGVTHFENGKPLIKMTMHPLLIQYTLPARVFHEMIHAVDEPNRYIVSPDRHGSPGFPDAVYGCQFACYGGIYDRPGDDELKEIVRYDKELVAAGAKDLPLYDEGKFVCPPDFPDCKAKANQHLGELLVYGKLCDQAKPYLPKEVVAAARRANAPHCIAQKLFNSCDEVTTGKECPAKPSAGRLCALKCATLTGKMPDGGPAEGLVAEVQEASERLVTAYDRKGQGLSTEDKVYYDLAKSKGILKSCLE